MSQNQFCPKNIRNNLFNRQWLCKRIAETFDIKMSQTMLVEYA